MTRGFGHVAHYVLAERDGDIVGILPLGQVRTRLFGHSLVSVPVCVYGGPLAADAEAGTALAEHAAGLMQRLGAPVLEFRFREVPDWLDAAEWPARPDLYVTFRKAFSDDDDANLKAIPRKQRAMVRKGIDRGLHSVIDTSADRLHGIYAESVRNLGTPVFARSYFRLLLTLFGADADIITILDGEEAISSVLNFYFRDEVLPYYGGGRGIARERHGNDFMYWEVIAAGRGEGWADVRLRPEQARHRRFRVQEELGIRAGAAGIPVPPCTGDGDSGYQPAEPEIPYVHCGVEASAAALGQSGRAADREGIGLMALSPLNHIEAAPGMTVADVPDRTTVNHGRQNRRCLQVAVPLGLGVIVLGLLFHQEVSAAVQTWIDSTAYSHCFFVLPIAAYLAWDRWDTLGPVPIRPLPWVALLAVPAGIVWLGAERIGLMRGPATGGDGNARAAGPERAGLADVPRADGAAAVSVLLVPFGAFVTPVLQNFTAGFIDVGSARWAFRMQSTASSSRSRRAGSSLPRPVPGCAS